MGDFTSINDDDAELLSGGVTPNPSKAYGSGTNYGQSLKSGGTDPNPGTFYGGTNYGKAKKA